MKLNVLFYVLKREPFYPGQLWEQHPRLRLGEAGPRAELGTAGPRSLRCQVSPPGACESRPRHPRPAGGRSVRGARCGAGWVRRASERVRALRLGTLRRAAIGRGTLRRGTLRRAAIGRRGSPVPLSSGRLACPCCSGPWRRGRAGAGRRADRQPGPGSRGKQEPGESRGRPAPRPAASGPRAWAAAAAAGGGAAGPGPVPGTTKVGSAAALAAGSRRFLRGGRAGSGAPPARRGRVPRPGPGAAQGGLVRGPPFPGSLPRGRRSSRPRRSGRWGAPGEQQAARPGPAPRGPCSPGGRGTVAAGAGVQGCSSVGAGEAAPNSLVRGFPTSAVFVCAAPAAAAGAGSISVGAGKPRAAQLWERDRVCTRCPVRRRTRIRVPWATWNRDTPERKHCTRSAGHYMFVRNREVSRQTKK